MPSEMDWRDIEAIRDAQQRTTGQWRTPASDFEIASKFLRTHPGNKTLHAKGGMVKASTPFKSSGSYLKKRR
jgi:hypothetical protein